MGTYMGKQRGHWPTVVFLVSFPFVAWLGVKLSLGAGDAAVRAFLAGGDALIAAVNSGWEVPWGAGERLLRAGCAGEGARGGTCRPGPWSAGAKRRDWATLRTV